MLGGRVEGGAIEDGMPSRCNKLTGEIRVHLRVECSSCPPVEQICKSYRKPDVLLLVELITVTHAEVRLGKPWRTESAGVAHSYSAGGRTLSDVNPLSAACDKRWECTRKSKTNIHIAGLRCPTVEVGEEAKVSSVVSDFVDCEICPALDSMRPIRGHYSTARVA